MSDRIENTKINIFYSYAYQITVIGLGLVSRVIFVNILGSTYLGVSALFSSVLAVLSFADLGISSAVGFALYKPLSEDNKEKIKSIMRFFKLANFAIGTAIFIFGVCAVPLLPLIATSTTQVNYLTLYYLIYLLSTSVTYFTSYRTILITSDQKEYKLKKAQIIATITTFASQIIILIFAQSYLLYLLAEMFSKVILGLVMNKIVAKNYPYILETTQKLDHEEFRSIKKNMVALIIHKLGEISIHQTDNIIIGAFLSIQFVGIVSNYTLMLSYALLLSTLVMNVAVPSIGNLIATESVFVRFEFYKKFRLLSYYIQGMLSIGFLFLSTPLLYLVFGQNYVMPQLAVLFIALSKMIQGEESAMYSYKIASGLYSPDKYIAFIQGIINLIVSILGVQMLGVSGVFLGTLVSMTFGATIRCKIIYSISFKGYTGKIYFGTLRYILFLVLSTVILYFIQALFTITTLFSFIIMLMLCLIVPSLIFIIIFYKTTEFEYYLNTILNKLKSIFKII